MITVITPVYNGDKFIESCLKVVIEQNCSDIEHIIVDGASKDKTVEIITEYAEKYPHIRWISEKDNGQSDAMNKGISMAKGEILAILNVDDYYEPNTLNRVAEIFQTLPEPSLLVGNCNIWENDNKLSEINKPNKIKFTDLLLGPCVTPLPMNPSAYFYHTSLHQQIGLYKVDEHYAMDIDFLLRAVQVAKTKYVDETWGNYRKIEGTKTVIDIASGQNLARLDALMKTYRQKLPLLQRYYVNIASVVYPTYIYRAMKYFWQNPQELPSSFKSKAMEIFGVIS